MKYQEMSYVRKCFIATFFNLNNLVAEKVVKIHFLIVFYI